VATAPRVPIAAVRASLPGRVVLRFIAVGGYDRALALATQAFVAVVPMLILVTAAVPGGGAAIGWLPAAVRDAARPLVRTPEASSTVAGAVLLVVSVVGFTRTLQRTYGAAWELPGPGWRGLGAGLLGAAVLVGEVIALVLVAPLVGGTGGAAVLLRSAAGVLVWWTVLRLLLGGRVGWRALLPGAVVTGVGQALTMALSDLVLPGLIERESARFGLIGVAFVLVSVLVVLGVLLVFSAVLGAELARTEPSERSAS
jgi:membrane protein